MDEKADYPGNSVGGAVGFSVGAKGYIGTGYSVTGNYSNEFWRDDPASDMWSEKTSLRLHLQELSLQVFQLAPKDISEQGCMY